jgi:hypothetical protein
MRRRLVVAAAALIAALALAGLPAPVGSRTSSTDRAVELAAFSTLNIPAISAPAHGASGVLDPADRSAGYLSSDTQLVEPGSAPEVSASRPDVRQPATSSGSAWKTPRYTISGYASFYDNGTTAMRLPRGTVVRICGSGGCVERTVTDYGPIKQIRIVDMYRPDFFQICGCSWYSGTTWVTVSIY